VFAEAAVEAATRVSAALEASTARVATPTHNSRQFTSVLVALAMMNLYCFIGSRRFYSVSWVTADTKGCHGIILGLIFLQ